VTALPEAGADVSISGEKLGFLIGPKAATLLAVQDLLRTVAFRKFGHDLGRINLDISGYRERRRQALAEFTRGVATEVVAQRQSRALEPMNASDRKVVHDTINDMDGISSRSEGEDPYRRVVLVPA
jgi:spoIIIJ-associated protein